jgi:hypothetical protein
VIVGSPSGLVQSYGFTLRDYEDDLLPSSTETWLSYGTEWCDSGTLVPYDGSGGYLKCHHETCEIVYWAYQEVGGASGTFTPQFGGHGEISFQHEMACHPKYVHFDCVDARSTDINADGVTDKVDKTAMYDAIQSPTPDDWFDLNIDSQVDWDDYRVILDEMTQEGRWGFTQKICNGGDYPVNRTVTPATDLVTPAAVSLGAGAGRYCVALHWTAPGDDGNTGMASQYDIRWAMSSFNAATFDQQQQVQAPTPKPAGSDDGVVVNSLQSCTWYYFAMKSIDQYGNTSGMSNVVSVKTKCSGNTQCYPPKASIAERNEPTGVTLAAGPTPAVSSSLIEYSIPASRDGEAFEVTVFDVSGRRIATLGDGRARAGTFEAEWDLKTADGSQVGAGVYYVRLRLGTEQATRRIVVVR